MSNTIRKYKGLEEDMGDGVDMLSITAFMAGEYGDGVQFTIGSKWCALTENQIKDLITTLQKRLKCSRYHSATDTSPIDWDIEYIHPEKLF